jgi:hypothetical protein
MSEAINNPMRVKSEDGRALMNKLGNILDGKGASPVKIPSDQHPIDESTSPAQQASYHPVAAAQRGVVV